jgi:hypothetical protein
MFCGAVLAAEATDAADTILLANVVGTRRNKKIVRLVMAQWNFSRTLARGRTRLQKLKKY